MEFEKDTTPVSDDARRLAETKKLTIEPIHQDIAPDDIPDAQVVAQHLTGPAIQNAPNDMEQSTQPIQPTAQSQQSLVPTKSTRYPRIIMGVVVVACVAVTVIVLLISQ